MPAPAQHPVFANEFEGQRAFFSSFRIDPEVALSHNTDGVHNGNLLEFKTHIADLNSVLFQAVKYLSKLRVRGVDVPAHILLVDLTQRSVYRFASADYDLELHALYNTAASRENRGFRTRSIPEVVLDYENPAAAQVVTQWLRDASIHRVRMTADCVVAWAERYYREVPGSGKADLLRTDPRQPGELRRPRHFTLQLHPFAGDSYAAFAHILDRLNDKLKKIELGAFYTPAPYVLKATELLRKAIERVPPGNDYVILDRCAGTGNLERFLSDEELSHVIVNTIEEFEYLELSRAFGDRVRAIIPPTHSSGDPHRGFLRNGDALSEAFVLGDAGRVIRDYVNDPKCTIILFENPPYVGVSPVEAQKDEGRGAFGWKTSWLRGQMRAALANRDTARARDTAADDLANVFIWSAFEHYLRQPTDSYVVFSPAKYFKTQALASEKRFLGGFLFNRKHFHAEKAAGISVIWWANECEPGALPGARRTEFPLEVFDVDRVGRLVAGSADGAAPESVIVRTAARRLSSLYAPLPDSTETSPSVACETNGTEAHRASASPPVRSEDTIGYLVAKMFTFENQDMNGTLTRCARYDGGGMYLTKENYLSALPLFATCRFPAEGKFWLRAVVAGTADNGDNFSGDADFLKSCLIYAALSRHNKCLSFTGSDGVAYRNELCLDTGTVASVELAARRLTALEAELLEQWQKVLEAAKKTDRYDAGKMYGLYQIELELNTSHKEPKTSGRGDVTVYDYPALNGDAKTLKAMLNAYHAEVITPKLWEYGLLK